MCSILFQRLRWLALSAAAFLSFMSNSFAYWPHAEYGHLTRHLNSGAGWFSTGGESINPQILQMALRAYQKAKQSGFVKHQMLTIIDYTKPSNQPRLWVIDPVTQKVRYNVHVSHGHGSGYLYPTRFSNQNGTHQSSIGVFLTGQPYYGNHGYSLRVYGLDHGINDHAYQRAIVFHPAEYVSESYIHNNGRSGRSFGCMALSPNIAPNIIQTIKNGSLVFAYYPDRHWLNQSKFLA